MIPNSALAAQPWREATVGGHNKQTPTRHQYVDRETFVLRTEELYNDRVIRFVYSKVRENAPSLFRLLTSKRASSLIAFLNYDLFLSRRIAGVTHFMHSCGIDWSECEAAPGTLDTPRKIFERKIRYWHCRPMTEETGYVVSPADARVLLGSLREDSRLFLKDKFFGPSELLGKKEWVEAFCGGDFAIFRLTPERYHYNHVPASGVVVDFFEVPGSFHSCNPSAVISLVTPYSKNGRVVTIIDTDVPGGSQAGLVAMVEVVALVVGKVDQCYSTHRYADPKGVEIGMFLERGKPKSLFRPGSSTDVLLFQPGRVRFDKQLTRNMYHPHASSRFTIAFGKPLVETNVKVRYTIGRALGKNGSLHSAAEIGMP